MSETTELSVIEIKPEQAPALYVANGLDHFLAQIREYAKETPDVTTQKGRDRIGSLARAVGSSKKTIEEPGRAYLRHLKEAVKPAEDELRRFTRECDAIRDAILLPRAEWDAEQARLKAEAEAKAAEEAYNAMRDDADKDNAAFDTAKAKELALQIEADHATALLDNYEYDRDIAEKNAEAERQRIAHEDELKRQAVEQAQREADEKIQREREASAKREADLKAQADQAERNRIAQAQKDEQDRKDAAAKAEADRLAAAQQAEREKQEAIEAEQLKAKQKEDDRLAEERRIADEAAARAANVEHKRAINQQAVADLVAAGITEECAVQCVKAIAKGQVSAIAITY
ncbi:hypothetical protein [Rahnella sp. ChDrAdgB13]|uniref:hypothetical protein n=1 Tax=Rahnella sp. ChDrAdgB13 TaxID=1850581 RepID=UPI001AD85711|nr:hypothetical protein [Rahnella sp. ChDrAdgB13]